MQIKQLQAELKNHKMDTKEKFKDMHTDMEKLENEVVTTQRVAEQVNNSMIYVTKAVDDVKSLVTGFTQMFTEHNKGVDKKLDTQSEKIDSFINSDKRATSKKELTVAVLQVIGGFVIALLGFWATGSFK